MEIMKEKNLKEKQEEEEEDAEEEEQGAVMVTFIK